MISRTSTNIYLHEEGPRPDDHEMYAIQKTVATGAAYVRESTRIVLLLQKKTWIQAGRREEGEPIYRCGLRRGGRGDGQGMNGVDGPAGCGCMIEAETERGR